MQELAIERQAIKAALAELLVNAFVFEADAGARTETIQETYLEAVEHADLYIGVFWKGYGAATIEEYEHAQTQGMDCLIYEKRDEVEAERDPKLQAFLDRIGGEVTRGHTPRWFTRASDLGKRVKEDVASWTAGIVQMKPTAAPLFKGVPTLPSHFVGRSALLTQLVGRLRSGEPALSTEGLPGVGKTTLAVALAQHPGVLRYFRDGVLWAGLGRSPNVMVLLNSWADALGMVSSPMADEAVRSQEVKDAIGLRRILLVIDDAWTLEAANLLRCGGPNCGHLLTTRNKEIARQFAGRPHAESVPLLEEDDAYVMLEKLAPVACASDPAAARNLVRTVGHLPLAVELLGGYLAGSEGAQFDVFSDLGEEALEKAADPQHRLSLAGKRLGSKEGAVTLRETILLSVEDLPEEAAQAFYSLGAFAPKPDRFSREAAEAVTGAPGRTLALLAARNLLEVDGQRLLMHQMLSDVARTRLEEAPRVRHTDFYLALVNGGDWKSTEEVYGQIRWAKEKAPEEGIRFIKYLGVYQLRRGLWRERLDWALEALEATPAERADVAYLCNEIGLVYSNLGDRQQALSYYERALPIMEEMGDRSELARTLNNIGRVHHNLGDRQQALSYYESAMLIWEEVGYRAGQAATLNNIGGVFDNLGDRRQALSYYERALPITEEVGDRSGLAATLNNIGMVYHKLGDRQQALSYYERALPIREELGDRSGLATTLTNIGVVYNNLGDRQQALSHYERALAIMEEVGDRSGLAKTLNNIGLVYHNLGDRQQALSYYERALPIKEEVGDRSGLAVTLTNIGGIYHNLGERQQALSYYERALPIMEEVGDRSELAVTLNNIGGVYDNLGDRQQALSYYERALAIMEEVGDRSGLAMTLNNIGLVYHNLGDRQQALSYFERALPIREEVGDRSGESVTRYNMAMVCRAERRYGDAVLQLRRVVELDRLVQHPYLESHLAMLAQVEAALRGEP